MSRSTIHSIKRLFAKIGTWWLVQTGTNDISSSKMYSFFDFFKNFYFHFFLHENVIRVLYSIAVQKFYRKARIDVSIWGTLYSTLELDQICIFERLHGCRTKPLIMALYRHYSRNSTTFQKVQPCIFRKRRNVIKLARNCKILFLSVITK